MPKGTRVDDLYQHLKSEGYDEGSAARIAQSATGDSLETGRPSKKGKRVKTKKLKPEGRRFRHLLQEGGGNPYHKPSGPGGGQFTSGDRVEISHPGSAYHKARGIKTTQGTVVTPDVGHEIGEPPRTHAGIQEDDDPAGNEQIIHYDRLKKIPKGKFAGGDSVTVGKGVGDKDREGSKAEVVSGPHKVGGVAGNYKVRHEDGTEEHVHESRLEKAKEDRVLGDSPGKKAKRLADRAEKKAVDATYNTAMGGIDHQVKAGVHNRAAEDLHKKAARALRAEGSEELAKHHEYMAKGSAKAAKFHEQQVIEHEKYKRARAYMKAKSQDERDDHGNLLPHADRADKIPGGPKSKKRKEARRVSYADAADARALCESAGYLEPPDDVIESLAKLPPAKRERALAAIL